MGVGGVEACLLGLALVIVVLDPFWSLLVLLVLLLFNFRLPVELGLGWCFGFRLVLSVVLSFVNPSVVVGLLEVAWLLELSRLLVMGLLVIRLSQCVWRWMLRLQLGLVVSIRSIVVAPKLVETERVKEIAIRVNEGAIRVHVKSSCIVNAAGGISRRASTWTS